MFNIIKLLLGRTKTNKISEICCVATPRTGTNYLFSGLNGIQNLLVNWEIFSPDECYINKRAKEAMVSRYRLLPEAIHQLSLHNKSDFFRMLRQVQMEMNIEHMIYKVFPTAGHISYKDLEKLIFPKGRTGLFLLIRNPLMTYISHKKASQLGVWGKVDTSDISILFEKNEFEDFDKKNTSMIVTVVKLCRKHKKRILILSYEDIFSYKTQDERISYVADRLNETLKTCLTSPAPHYIEHFKQDRSPLNRNIQNYSIMKMYLEKQGLGVLMNENSDAYKQRLPFIEEILKEQ